MSKVAIGTRLPAEKKVLRDERTGAVIWQLTDAPCVNHAPYFLNPAWAGPRHDMLIITSYRDGSPNLYGIQLPDGEIVQLTTRGDLSPWSACVSPDGRRVFYTGGAQLRAVEVGTFREEVLAEVPAASWLGNCSIRPDGREVLTATQRNGRHALLAVRTDGSGSRVIWEADRLIAHAQWSPDGRTILFASDLPRMWLIESDGTNPRPLRNQTRQEWITHESWRNNEEIIFTLWPHALKGMRRDGTGERTIAAFNCWHPAPSPDGKWVICDTTLPDIGLHLIDAVTGDHSPVCYPQASCKGTQWAEPEPIWEGSVWEEAYGPQWTHPHPAFSPDGRAVTYTSDRTGHPQVYLVFVDSATAR
jgi:oligogalacturonide lyase